MESSLIELMERHSIGTDATVAEHIQKQLDRGARMVELLKQPAYSPLRVEEQVVAIFAGTRGYLDSLEVKQVGPFEAHLLEAFRTQHRDILDDIRTSGKLPEGDRLGKAIEGVKASFAAKG